MLEIHSKKPSRILSTIQILDVNSYQIVTVFGAIDVSVSMIF